ncbi:cell division protein ZapA [Alphaproteobacteria bacterium]|nr:cell division protein ZapA [Alphaproteobacteria bacterium]
MSNKVTVNININNNVYPVSCVSGEENRLIQSSKEVNVAIDELSNISSGISETRLLAMAALVLADKLIEKGKTLENNDASNLNETNLQSINELLDWLNNATNRMNKVAKLLETK